MSIRRPKHEKPVYWHVFARGTRRLGLIWGEDYAMKFLEFLSAAVAASGAVLVGYTLMTNHFHLMLEATTAQLSRCMQRLDWEYACYHNEQNGLVGHAFEGPYQAYVQPNFLLALCTLAYIFLNPVRAGIARTPTDYRWTCAGDYLGGAESPLPVDVLPVFRRIHPDPAIARMRFRKIVAQEQERRPPRKRADAWSAVDVQRQQFAWLLDIAKERVSLMEGEDPARVAMLWARDCGIFPRAMTDAFPGSTPTQISQAIYRLKTRLENEGRLERLRSLISQG